MSCREQRKHSAAWMWPHGADGARLGSGQDPGEERVVAVVEGSMRNEARTLVGAGHGTASSALAVKGFSHKTCLPAAWPPSSTGREPVGQRVVDGVDVGSVTSCS